MRSRELGVRGLSAWGLALFVMAACASSREVGQEVGGESHFLRYCDAQCGSGFDCIQGLCTRGCVVGKDSCSDLLASARCTADSVEPGEVAVCDLACTGDADCLALSASHRCESGFCRAPATANTASDAGAPDGDAGASPPYPSDRVFPCPAASVDDDSFDVMRSVVQDDTLVLTLRYGGCPGSEFALCFEDSWAESYPVQVGLRVLPITPNYNFCLALPTEEHRFDLTPLAQAYTRMYRQSAGLIETSYGLYAFGALSCEERVRGAEGQVSDYERAVSRSCQTADDCTWTSNSTRCTARCGVVASVEGAAELAEWLAATSASVCGDYEGDGCGPVLVPPCAPPRPLACADGLCVEQ